MTEEGRKEKERGQEHTQWGEVGEGEAVCGVSVTCPGGVAWVECAALACACGGGGRDRGRETQAGQGQHSVCVYVGVGGGGWCGGRGGAGCECVCVGLHVWRVGRDRGRASQPGKGQRSVCVHVRACTRCRGVRVGAGCSWAVCGGGGDRVRMRVCTPCGAGGVCVRVPGVCLGMVQAERDAARRKGRRSVCVCVCVCVWYAHGACGVRAGRDRETQPGKG